MGSVTGSLADNYGVRVPPINAPRTTLGPNQTWILTSLYDPSFTGSNWTTSGGTVYTPFEYGWRVYSFQLVRPTGGGSGNLTVNATTDQATAAGVGSAWEPVPFTNGGTPPSALTLVAFRLAFADTGQWVAFRFTTPGGYGNTTNSYLLMGASAA